MTSVKSARVPMQWGMCRLIDSHHGTLPSIIHGGNQAGSALERRGIPEGQGIQVGTQIDNAERKAEASETWLW